MIFLDGILGSGATRWCVVIAEIQYTEELALINLGSTLPDIWHRFQGELFPALAQQVDPLIETHKRFVTVLDLVKVECFVGEVWNGPGRP